MIHAVLNGFGTWGSRLINSVQNKSSVIHFDAAITRDAAKHEQAAKSLGLRLFEDEHEALEDPRIGAVVLATPHSHHHRQILSGAAAGKHVFVEKPFTLTRSEAQEAIAACRQARVTLGVGFNRRYAPAVVEMRRRIASGDIGEVLHLEGQFSGPSGYHLKEGQWRAERHECPAGAMTARGVHTVDCMVHLAGLVRSVSAVSKRRVIPVDIDDVTAALLTFSSGATGLLSTIHTTADIWRLHVFGSKGWMETRGDVDLVVRGLEGEPERVELANVDKERAMLEEFASAVLERRPTVITDEEVLNGVVVVESIVASSETNTVIQLG